MGRIGETLRKAREAKNLTLRDVEAATKIRLKYLEALENEDFSQLPGRVYTIGFLRSYAKFLGLDDYALVAEYKASNKNQDATPVPTPESGESENIKGLSPNLIKIVAFALVIFLMVSISVIYQHQQDNSEPLENQLSSSAGIEQQDSSSSDLKEEPSVESPPIEANPPEIPENTYENEHIAGLNVEVRAIDEPGNACWINVIIDGKQHFSGTLAAGQSMDFQGEKVVRIKFGNAGGVRVKVNGKDQGVIGEKGSVKTLEFNIDEINS